MSANLPQRGGDCWTTIGRPGAGTCPELERHILCRNCPTYSAAALRLLERPAPQEYVREWTAHLAAEAQSAVEATDSVFLFRLASEWFALPTTTIEQVIEPSRVHSVPHRKLPVRGVVSVRGELVICVSLEALLGVKRRATEKESGSSPRLVVMMLDGARVAFQPDEVYGVARHGPADVIAAPATLTRSAGAHFTTCLLQWRAQTAACLDAAQLFSALTRSFA